jgi:hypothetical protein
MLFLKVMNTKTSIQISTTSTLCLERLEIARNFDPHLKNDLSIYRKYLKHFHGGGKIRIAYMQQQ